MVLDKKMVTRVFNYVLGLFIMSLGVSFSVASNLGVSPVSAIPYVSSVILNCDMGICTTSIFVIYIVLQMFLMGKEYNKKNVFQIVPASMMGVMVSLTNSLLAGFDHGNNYFLQVLFVLIGIVLVAFGVVMYVGAGIMSLPPEGVMEVLSYKTGMPLHRAKTIFDCTVVVITIVLSLVCLGCIDGIREGSLLSAVGVGFCIKQIKVIIEKIAIRGKKPNIN